MDIDDFDRMYGKGMYNRVLSIIDDLAPVTRRDDWWSTFAPHVIIATHLMSPKGDSDAP